MMIKSDSLIQIAQDAGRLILDLRSSGYQSRKKKDDSFVTEVDIKASELIVGRLVSLTPNIPVISEELWDDEGENIFKKHEYIWLVDPIDGTNGFVQGRDDFSVNIALIQNNQPVQGIIYAPALDELFYAKKNHGSFKIVNGRTQEISCKSLDQSHITALTSSKTNKVCEEFLIKHGVEKSLPVGSAIKFCWIAEGRADLYPRFGRTMEWDTASGQIILTEAGGIVVDEALSEMVYNKDKMSNPYFIACSLDFYHQMHFMLE